MSLPYRYGFLEETSSAPPMTDESSPLGAVRGVLRGFAVKPWLLWTTLRCCVKTNLGPVAEVAEVLFFYMVFFSLTNADIHLLMCWKKWRRKHRKKTNSLISWWAMLDGLKRKKTFFRCFADLSNAFWKVQEKPVSTSPMSCATPIPRKTEM